MSVQAANYFGDNLAQGQAGPLGLVVIVVLFIACWFLYRSMSKHMKRIPTSFDPPPEETPDGSTVDQMSEDGPAESGDAAHRS